MPRRSPALLADIGSTNARFALCDAKGRIGPVRVLATADHPSLGAAARAFLATVRGPEPRRAAIAVAAPVIGDRVRLTNRVWSFSIAALERSLGLARLEVSDAKKLRALEDENAKLKKLLADAMLDNAGLKELLAKKW
ncbi:MAG: hypothetical protein FJX67_13115, partial [Alphaproteobacteria bacterium]|nr:hypothetical protein [Alphaproteobacteria bacterium]